MNASGSPGLPAAGSATATSRGDQARAWSITVDADEPTASATIS